MNTESQTTSTRPSSPPTAVAPAAVTAVVRHRVEDFDSWKQVFDAHADARAQAGVVGHHINRSVDDPNLLSIYLAAADRQQLEAFFASDDLRQTMSRAGVSGPPTIALMTPVEDLTVKRDPLYGMIVVHDVADFDAWKQVYDEVEPLRREAGIVGHAVNRGIDEPNRVVVYHQAETLEALQNFASSEELKAAMQRAGVSSAPEFSFNTGAGWGSY